MSNTWNTPVEALEFALPVLVESYGIRRDSGGEGLHKGGEGLRRDLRLLCAARANTLGERRVTGPYGLNGGEPGSVGKDQRRRGDDWRQLPGKGLLELEPGDVISIGSPGGGGWGKPPDS